MKKFLFFLAVMLVIFWGFNAAEASFKWSQVGRAPLMPGPPIEDKISLEEKMILHKGEIIEGLKLAEPNWDAVRIFETIFSTIRRGNVSEENLPRGTEFYWMIFKGKAGVGVVRDVEWVGVEPLHGFILSFFYGKEVKIFIPKRCGNISLMKTFPSSQPSVSNDYRDYREQRPDYYRQPERQPIIIYQEYRPQYYQHYSPPPPPPPSYYRPHSYESFFSFLPPPPPLFFGGKKEKHYHYYFPPSESIPQRRPPGVRTR